MVKVADFNTKLDAELICSILAAEGIKYELREAEGQRANFVLEVTKKDEKRAKKIIDQESDISWDDSLSLDDDDDDLDW